MEALSSLPPHRRLEIAIYRYAERHGVEKLFELIRWVKFVVARQEREEERPLQDLREAAKKTETYRLLTNPTVEGVLSLDLLLYDDGDDNILDIIPGEMESAEEALFRKQIFGLVGEFLKTLPEKEAKIIVLRVGVGCEPCSKRAVAYRLGIQQDRVHQLEKELFRKLRQFLIGRKAI